MAIEVYIIGNWAGTKGKETWAYAYDGDKNIAYGKINQPYTTKPLLAGAVEGALFGKSALGYPLRNETSIRLTTLYGRQQHRWSQQRG